MQAVAPLVEDDQPEPIAGGAPAARERGEPPPPAPAPLSGNERAILAAMKNSGYALRSTSGIAADVGLDEAAMRAAIDSLLARGLIGETLGKSGQSRWFLTKSGRLWRDA
jgi:hypothetical protein